MADSERFSPSSFMGRFEVLRYRVGNLRTSFANCVVTLTVLLAPFFVHAQCEPVGPRAQGAGAQRATAAQPEFFDEPKFTVAGVTDTSNPGGHGSDVIWRTQEALAKETTSLRKQESATGSSAPITENSLREAAREPGNFEANHRLGKLLLDDGKARDALPYLEQASRLNPEDYENAYELALAYADAGDYEHSLTNARALLAHQDKARQDKAEVHHLLGEVEEKLGNPLEAVHEYQRAAELDPSEPNLFDWGAELLLHHAPEPASEVFGKGNRLFPRSSRMLVGLGVAWYARGSDDQATACLCQAADLNPNDPTPYLFLGKIQNAEATASDQIGERLKRFAALQPEDALANYYYAVSLWKQRKGPEDTENLPLVESLLQKAVHLDPKLGAAYLQLGILYAERKEFSKAVSAYEKAVDADPGLEAAHYRLAQAYRRTGENSKAEHELQIYEQISKETAQRAERERRELQQFVYTLRDRTPAVQPQ
jgi:tetratricopeptide (TPR) repeat protein